MSKHEIWRLQKYVKNHLRFDMSECVPMCVHMCVGRRKREGEEMANWTLLVFMVHLSAIFTHFSVVKYLSSVCGRGGALGYVVVCAHRDQSYKPLAAAADVTDWLDDACTNDTKNWDSVCAARHVCTVTNLHIGDFALGNSFQTHRVSQKNKSPFAAKNSFIL